MRHGGSEFFEVAEILLDRIVGSSMVDVHVEMDQDVAETHPALQPCGEILADETLFGEDLDGALVAHRLPITLIRDHMVRDVEHALAGEVEVSFRQVMQRRLANELLTGGAAERAQLSEIVF